MVMIKSQKTTAECPTCGAPILQVVEDYVNPHTGSTFPGTPSARCSRDDNHIPPGWDFPDGTVVPVG